jgi:hypothetical protein
LETLPSFATGVKTPAARRWTAPAAIDYGISYSGTPAVGDTVLFDRPHGHDGVAGGVVIGTVEGCLGTLLAVEVEPGRTVDMHWQRCCMVSPDNRSVRTSNPHPVPGFRCPFCNGQVYADPTKPGNVFCPSCRGCPSGPGAGRPRAA